jgi:hypothetical protein
MIPLRLVIDTNIVVSAALKPDGLQRTVLLLATAKPATLYVSEAIWAEYGEVLARPELKIRKGFASNYSSSFGAGRVRSGHPARCRSRKTRTTTSSSNAPTWRVRTIS